MKDSPAEVSNYLLSKGIKNGRQGREEESRYVSSQAVDKEPRDLTKSLKLALLSSPLC